MKNKNREEWLPVAGWEGIYEVSESGRVRSLDRIIYRNGFPSRVKGRERKPGVDRFGVRVITLNRTAEGKKVHHKTGVHRLVAMAFLPAPDETRKHINHKDGRRRNNHFSNLEWVTPAENSRHAADHGLLPRGERHGNSVLKLAQVRFIKKALARGVQGLVLARRYEVDPGTISHIKRGLTWKWA
jgi:hypothetical protein